MRSFIAIALNEDLKAELAGLQSFLKASGADVKWVQKDNIHITLKFLGDVQEERISFVKTALDDIAEKNRTFEIALGGIGAFPKPSFPKVIWVGMQKGSAESSGLAKMIEERLERIGFSKEERPFRSHVTIGRVRSPKHTEALQEKMLTARLKHALIQKVTTITLFKSQLTSQGPIYTVIHESNLK